MKIKQLASKYVLVNGIHCVEYQLQTVYPYIFTDLKGLWEDSLDDIPVVFSEGRTIATYIEKLRNKHSRAIKYTDSELKFIFGDVITLKSKVVTPTKYRI